MPARGMQRDAVSSFIEIASDPKKFKAAKDDLDKRLAAAQGAEAKAEAEQAAAKRMKAEVEAAVAALGKERMAFEAAKSEAEVSQRERADRLGAREAVVALREAKAQEREDLVATRERDVQAVLSRQGEEDARLAAIAIEQNTKAADIASRETALAEREAKLKNRVNALVADL